VTAPLERPSITKVRTQARGFEARYGLVSVVRSSVCGSGITHGATTRSSLPRGNGKWGYRRLAQTGIWET
jgi:hypothetical protein